MGFIGVLTLVFIILKLVGVIAWSWWLVLLPILIVWGLWALFMVICVGAATGLAFAASPKGKF